MKPKKSITKKLIAAAFFAIFINSCGSVRAQEITTTVKTEPAQEDKVRDGGSFAQGIEFGKYVICYDMYWRCHFQNFLELKPDSTYEFIYMDDTRGEKTEGMWHIEHDFLVLTPFVIPDTVNIKVFEGGIPLNKRNIKDNFIAFKEHFKAITELNVNLFSNGWEFVLETDAEGEIQYDGDVIDSISFVIKGRELKVVTKTKDTPSGITVYIDTDYKDLIYRTPVGDRIMIKDGKMFISVRYENKIKTEYFERIEN
jgi:hypothetical protein